MNVPGMLHPSALTAPLAVLASGPPDEATEIALTITIIVMLAALAVVFFVVLLPDTDRLRLGRAISSLRRYVVAGRAPEVSEFDHEFDGIRELDNRIPPWFTYLFIGTIVFAAVYMADYHVLGTSKLMEAEYRDEVAAADLHRRIVMATEGNIDENTLAALDDPEALKRGAEQFQKYCVSCHGPQGGGVVGPNLTDQYWIHGGAIRNVYLTIKQGVPAKGMISWQLVFTPKQIQELSSYVLSLRGTNPAGGKKPEGTLEVERDTSGTQL